MTVQELILELQKWPRDAEVVCSTHAGPMDDDVDLPVVDVRPAVEFKWDKERYRDKAGRARIRSGWVETGPIALRLGR